MLGLDHVLARIRVEQRTSIHSADGRVASTRSYAEGLRGLKVEADLALSRERQFLPSD